jgi:peptide/nickel transport system permease protein
MPRLELTLSGRQLIWHRFRTSSLGKVLGQFSGALGTILILAIIFVAIFAPCLTPHDPDVIDVFNKLAPPSKTHLMGTDELGRDLFTRILYGSRIALIVSLPAIGIGVIISMLLGVIAGYGSTWVGSLLLILFDSVRAFPTIIFAITIMALTGGANLPILIAVIGITRFPGYSRLIRVQTLKVRENDYISAAKGTGCSYMRIVFRHILPNAIGPLFIQAAMDIPVVITIEAGLSFLGLGVPPPTPSWGAVLRSGYAYVRTSPWMVVFGGLALIVATLGFTLLGETLRDVFDPKLRRA